MDLKDGTVSVIMMEDGSMTYSTVVESEIHGEEIYHDEDSHFSYVMEEVEVDIVKEEQIEEVEVVHEEHVEVGGEVDIQTTEPQTDHRQFQVPMEAQAGPTESCFICKEKIRTLIDPWGNIYDCYTTTSNIKMVDQLVKLLASSRDSKPVTFKVSFNFRFASLHNLCLACFINGYKKYVYNYNRRMLVILLQIFSLLCMGYVLFVPKEQLGS